MIPSSEHFLFHAANAQKKAYEARKLRCKGYASSEHIQDTISGAEIPAREYHDETFWYNLARIMLVLTIEAKRMEEME